MRSKKSKKPFSNKELKKLNDGASARYLPIGDIDYSSGIPSRLKDKMIWEVNFCPYCESKKTFHAWIQKIGDIVGNVWKSTILLDPRGFVSCKYDFCLDCRKEFVFEIYIYEKVHE